MSDLIEKLKSYYVGRVEDLTPHSDSCIRQLMDRIPRDRTRVPSSREVSLQSISHPSDLHLVEQVREYSANLLAALEGSPQGSFKVHSIDVKVNCSTNPLKVTLENSATRTYYIKEFDPIRVIGLELYNLVGPDNVRYPFAFTAFDIVEPEIEGRHIKDISESEMKFIKRSPAYQSDRVLVDIYQERFGLSDIVDGPSNYLVTPGGRLVIIDFDGFNCNMQGPTFNTEMKKQTCTDLGISEATYDKIYKDESLLFNSKVQRALPQLESFLSTMDVRAGQKMKNEDFIIGMYAESIRRKLFNGTK